MNKETRIAMLVGLVFIVMFGLVLSELTKVSNPTPPAKALASDLPSRGYTAEFSPTAAPIHEITPVTGTTGPADEGVEVMKEGTAPVEHLTTVEFTLRPPAGAGDRSLTAVGNFSLRDEKTATPPMTIAAAGSTSTATTQPASVAGSVPGAAAAKTYKVQAKDSLRRIARQQYGADNEEQYALIFQANKSLLKSADTPLQIGQELVIPPLPSETKAAKGAKDSDAKPAALADSHEPAASSGPAVPLIQELTAEQLSKRFATPPGTVSAAGNKAAKAPKADGESNKTERSDSADAAVKTYTVRPGDTLAKIARSVLKDDSPEAVAKIMSANKDRIKRIETLQVGTKLEIPI